MGYSYGQHNTGQYEEESKSEHVDVPAMTISLSLPFLHTV